MTSEDVDNIVNAVEEVSKAAIAVSQNAQDESYIDLFQARANLREALAIAFKVENC